MPDRFWGVAGGARTRHSWALGATKGDRPLCGGRPAARDPRLPFVALCPALHCRRCEARLAAADTWTREAVRSGADEFQREHVRRLRRGEETGPGEMALRAAGKATRDGDDELARLLCAVAVEIAAREVADA